VLPLAGCSLAAQQAIRSEQAPVQRRVPSADVVAFCSPDPVSPQWRRQLATLADIGVTGVHGPCRTPPAPYTVLEPGARYASQSDYLTLAGEAQILGMGVVVYDPLFWTDPAAAAEVWAEYIADGTVLAVDLGDEPHFNDMAELDRRARLVRTAGVEPQVIFAGSMVQDLTVSHRMVPTACPTSDDYEQNAAAMADAFILRLEAGCSGIAIDTTGRDLDHDGDIWSVGQIDRARTAGMRITLFTGVRPENTPDWDALVDDHGHITTAGIAVKEALR
jgi:hypothetical protein